MYTLERVRYVPELKKNLIFMREFDDLGMYGRIGDGTMTIIKGSLIIFKRVKKNGIFVTRAKLVFDNVATTSSTESDSTLKWNKRLAHVSKKGLVIRHKKGSFGKDLISKIPFFENFTIGKHHRLHFDFGKHKTTSLLEYVHSDLWGLTSTITQKWNKYFISTIDVFSRKV